MATRVRMGLLVLASLLATAGTSHAIEGCKVKVDPHDGALLLSARNVAANPRWGFVAGQEATPLANEGACVVAGVAKKCELGAQGTPQRITPPDLCTLYVTDDSASRCAVYIKGCVPGVRDAAQGPPGPPGDAGVAGPAGPGIVVKDANGTVLGVYTGRQSTAGFGYEVGVTLMRNVGGVPVELLLLPTASDLRGSSCLVYDGTDCSGTTAIRSSGGTFLNPVLTPFTAIVGSTLYYGIGPPSPFARQSMNCGDGQGCLNNSATDAAVPGATYDLSGFVPPFRVEVQ